MNSSSNDAFRVSVDHISTSQQSATQSMLLNAIKSKFANNENQFDATPQTLSIPTLKLPPFSAANSLDNGQNTSKLNQFLLGQLTETQSSSGLGAFAIPNLRIPNNTDSTTFTLPNKLILKDTASEANISSLNKGISDLKVCEDSKTPVIDLTIALNRSSTLSHSTNKHLSSVKPNPIDFQIPFIDCDIKESITQLPMRDEYCQTDVSDFVSKGNRYISMPSRFGRITCLKYKSRKRIRRIDHSFHFKHEINRFNFDTKSPDDIVLTSLRKYNKV